MKFEIDHFDFLPTLYIHVHVFNAEDLDYSVFINENIPLQNEIVDYIEDDIYEEICKENKRLKEEKEYEEFEKKYIYGG